MTTVGITRHIAVHNILFATDFSACSSAALPYALAIAHQFGARIFGTYIIPTEDYLLLAPEAWPAHMSQEERMREEAAGRLAEQLRGVPHQVLSGTGDVWNEILRMIEEHAIDMVVLGSHGRTGARKFLMGSVAERIFRQSPCPVLVVGPNVTDKHQKVAEFNHVLLATDLGKEAGAAASYAASIAHEHQARLSLLHVLNRPAGSGEDEVSEAACRRLRELVPPDVALVQHPHFFVQSGDAGERITRLAAANQVDLLVIGLHPKRGPVGAITHLAHTTAQHLVAHATCPVLTIRP